MPPQAFAKNEHSLYGTQLLKLAPQVSTYWMQ